MNPIFKNSHVTICCPGCNGAQSTYEHRLEGKEFGTIVVENRHTYQDQAFTRIIYILMKCAGCSAAGLAKVHCTNSQSEGVLESFYPYSFQPAKLPKATPQEVVNEFREAESCMSHQLWRSASAMFRSAIEKTLKANGYTKEKNLEQKIDAAAADGVITEARKQKAHDEVRSLGNDVLHDEWRLVSMEEAESAHHYIQRIVEDFYDDRTAVEKILNQKGRI